MKYYSLNANELPKDNIKEIDMHGVSWQGELWLLFVWAVDVRQFDAALNCD